MKKEKKRERERERERERNRKGKSKESTDDGDDVHANLATRSLLLSFRPSSAIPRVPLCRLFEVNPTRNTGCPLASESVSRSPKPLCRAGCLRAHRHARSSACLAVSTSRNFPVNLDASNPLGIFSNAPD